MKKSVSKPRQSLYLRVKNGGEIVQFDDTKDARVFIDNLYKTGRISGDQVLEYCRYLNNGYESVTINGYTVFEWTTPAV